MQLYQYTEIYKFCIISIFSSIRYLVTGCCILDRHCYFFLMCSAFQYDDAFIPKKLSNWQSPKLFEEVCVVHHK